MIGLFAALVLFAQASPAAAPAEAPKTEAPKTEAPAKVEAKAKEAASPDKVICHYEVVAGTHFKTKVCQTQRAEANRQEQDQDAFRRARDQNQTMPH